MMKFNVYWGFNVGFLIVFDDFSIIFDDFSIIFDDFINKIQLRNARRNDRQFSVFESDYVPTSPFLKTRKPNLQKPGNRFRVLEYLGFWFFGYLYIRVFGFSELNYVQRLKKV